MPSTPAQRPSLAVVGTWQPVVYGPPAFSSSASRRSRKRRSASSWKRQRTAISLTRLLRPAEPPQQPAPRRVQVAVVIELKAIDDGEPRLGAIRLGDRDRPTQLHDRRVGEAGKLAVQGRDLGQSRGSSACRDAIAACTT